MTADKIDVLERDNFRWRVRGKTDPLNFNEHILSSLIMKNAKNEEQRKKLFEKTCKMIGDTLKQEYERRGMTRVSAANYLVKKRNISKPNAYLRLLNLHRKPNNVTVKSVCAALGAFGYKLAIVKKTTPEKQQENIS